MQNKVNLFNRPNNSKSVKFYGKTVIDGKVITSKNYADAPSAMEWGAQQLNRDCMAIYYVSPDGKESALNVLFY